MEDKIQAYRQPLVTATGIILGFILNFAANWVKADSQLSETMAYFVGLCVLVGTTCLIIVLYRLLNMTYPREKAESYYMNTLYVFMTGVCWAFSGVLVDMFANFMAE